MRDITLEDTFRHQFTTRAFATGIPTTLAGSPVLSVLEENNATPITAGVSVSVDRASVGGLNEATIVATAANGYESGKSYAIYISTGTVGGVSVVGEVVGHFTVELAAAAVDLANGTDGLGAIKGDTAAILTDTGTTIPGTITTLQNDLDIITDSDGVILGAAGVDLILDEVNTVGAHNVNNSLGKQIREGTAAVVISSGDCPTSGSHTTTAVVLKASENATNDVYNNKRISFSAGTNVGFDAMIVDYDGAGKICTVTPALPAACDNTTDYEITAAMVHAETQAEGYDGAVWIGPSGSTTAIVGHDGTKKNPIDDGQMANAKTVADALGVVLFHVLPTSSITLVATLNGYEFKGENWSLAGGGQDVGNTTFFNAKSVTGVFTGTTPRFVDCGFGACTLPPCTMVNALLTDDTTGVTQGSAGNFFVLGWKSGVAGNGTPVWTWDGGGTSDTMLRDGSGGIKFEAMVAGEVASVETDGQFVEGTCSGGAVTLRGCADESGNANITLTKTAAINLTTITTGTLAALEDNALAGAPTAGSAADILNDLDARLPASGTISILDAAAVNAEVVDVLETDVHAEPAGVPGWSMSLKDAILWVATLARNKITQTATTQTLRNDADGADIASATVSDDGTTATRGEFT